jgi:hypothetical protein
MFAKFTTSEEPMKRLAFILMALVMLFFAMPVSADAAPANYTAYNPCDHLAEQYKQLDGAQYQGLVNSCDAKPAASTQDKVQQAASTAQNVAVIAQGVGAGVGDAAKGVGGAISDLAKNLGVTINDFLHSPAGVLLAFVLVVKFIGGKIFVIPFVVFVVTFWWYVVNRISRDVEYEYVPILWGAFQKRRVKNLYRRRDNEFVQWFTFLSAIGGGLLCLIVALNV